MHEKKKDKKGLSPWLAAVLDLLLAGGILLVFTFFQLVLPALRAAPVEAAPTPAPPSPTPEATQEPDTRTEWQKKFAAHFTDEPVWTENSYTSPNVSIQLETRTLGEGSGQTVYHVADIYVGSLDNICTYTANNELKYYSTQDAMEMDEASGALLAISGDFYSYQKSGFLIRNGEVYSTEYAYSSVCVMFYDGSIEVYPQDGYDIDALMERGIYQAWSFGPPLLDEEGKTFESYNVSTTVGYPNPRSAIGYYEPGHYCFVVADGRQEGYSKGLTVWELAGIFEGLGCKSAYNLDGGGSALMTFHHQRYSRQSNGADRELGDIILIRETEAGA